jgi:hypothetical protein
MGFMLFVCLNNLITVHYLLSISSMTSGLHPRFSAECRSCLRNEYDDDDTDDDDNDDDDGGDGATDAMMMMMMMIAMMMLIFMMVHGVVVRWNSIVSRIISAFLTEAAAAVQSMRLLAIALLILSFFLTLSYSNLWFIYVTISIMINLVVSYHLSCLLHL